MEIQEYINNQKTLQSSFLQFLNEEDDNEENYHNLIKEINNQKILKNQDEFSLFLIFISKVSDNHYHRPNFLAKIEKILINFKKEIKKYLTNEEIFLTFKKNKLIILFLIKEKILKIDNAIFSLINKIDSSKFYLQYFFKEISKFLSKDDKKRINKNISKYSKDEFQEKRQIGENDTSICELIRKDSIEQFIMHVEKNSCLLDSKIGSSYFETNSFLLKKNPTLIEYAAFFGSIQIFRYLYLNNVELTPSLWLYAIHGENPEIINILEEKGIDPEDSTYLKCLEESIKCHNNDFASYFKNKILEKDNNNLNSEYIENDVAYSLHYQNFSFLPEDDNKLIFYYSCVYNQYTLAKLYLHNKSIDINEPVSLRLIKLKKKSNKKKKEILKKKFFFL